MKYKVLEEKDIDLMQNFVDDENTKYEKEKLIDFVASDTHCTKKRDYKSLKRAYNKIKHKDQKYADIIFIENASNILK